jgi:succinyl-diaminopimelate desuccinylase
MIGDFLSQHGIDFAIYKSCDTMPNIVAHTHFNPAGKQHLVLNGHMDVFPVPAEADWTHGPWSADLVNGTMYGRGVVDMKVGVAASIFTYKYLREIPQTLGGRLTLAIVSDEETFGPHGAKLLFKDYASEVEGTACLNGEPSSPYVVRFGEKGAVWIKFTVRTPGGHGAYANTGKNAVDVAYQLIQELYQFRSIAIPEPSIITEILRGSDEAFERAHGQGAFKIVQAPVVNVGTMEAGPKVNMIASYCNFSVDFRLPIGLMSADLFSFIDRLRDRFEFEYEPIIINEPNWCAPDGDLCNIVVRNAELVTGIKPVKGIGIGNTDARLWRYRNIPAVVYGPTGAGMGGVDERASVEGALNVLKVHALSAYDYLAAG